MLVRQSTQAGELVIDPFMGSGSAGVAAIRAGRAFAGSDLCAEAVTVAAQRFTDAGATVTAWDAVPPSQGTLLGVG